MRTYDIYYENIVEKGDYLKLLEQIVVGGFKVRFHIQGVIVEIESDMKREEIEKKIYETLKEFEEKHIEIGMHQGTNLGGQEAILLATKRLTAQATSNNACYSFPYHGKEVKVVPGSQDFDLLFQMIQINREIFKENAVPFITMDANPGEEIVQFGERVFKKIQKGQNVLAIFNDVEIPFTTDMIEAVCYRESVKPYNGFTSTDAWTFTLMYMNMMNVRGRQYEALSYCEGYEEDFDDEEPQHRF